MEPTQEEIAAVRKLMQSLSNAEGHKTILCSILQQVEDRINDIGLPCHVEAIHLKYILECLQVVHSGLFQIKENLWRTLGSVGLSESVLFPEFEETRKALEKDYNPRKTEE